MLDKLLPGGDRSRAVRPLLAQLPDVQPAETALENRLDQSGALTAEVEAELLMNAAAVEVVTSVIPELWQGRRHPKSGEITTELNRHLVLHGTGVGWNSKENAVRAGLLRGGSPRRRDGLPIRSRQALLGPIRVS